MIGRRIVVGCLVVSILQAGACARDAGQADTRWEQDDQPVATIMECNNAWLTMTARDPEYNPETVDAIRYEVQDDATGQIMQVGQCPQDCMEWAERTEIHLGLSDQANRILDDAHTEELRRMRINYALAGDTQTRKPLDVVYTVKNIPGFTCGEGHDSHAGTPATQGGTQSQATPG